METDEDKCIPQPPLAEPANHTGRSDNIVTADQNALPNEVIRKIIDFDIPTSSRTLEIFNESTNQAPYSFITPQSKRDEGKVNYARASKHHTNNNWESFEKKIEQICFHITKPHVLKQLIG